MGNKIFISFFLSLIVGIMDGFGLAMFIPLLQMVDESKTHVANNMGNMSFIANFFAYLNIPLNLVSVLLIIFIFFCIKGVFKFLEGYFRASLEQLFIRDIRKTNILGLSAYSFNQFINSDIGRIQNTFSGEVEKVKLAYRYYFMGVQLGVFTLVYTAMAFFSNPQFAIMVVIGGSFTSLLVQQLKRKSKILSQKITEDSHVFQSLLIQKVSFFKYLKSTGLVDKYASKLLQNNKEMHSTQKKLGVIGAILGSVREPIVIMVVLLSILIEVKYFHQHLGVIIFTLLLFYRSLISLTSMQTYFNLFLSSSGSLQNMSEFNQELKAGKEKDGNIEVLQFQKALEFKSTSFSYESTHILTDINLTINKNQSIAVIGESGSGKTTLINLITGILSPTKGQVIVDDIDLEQIKKSSYQSRIGYITQEAVIFNDTIFNNVSFWDEPTPANQLRFDEALRKAAIYDFVDSLPQKGNAMLGSNGINISGGQKQRISIARELYKEIDFLLMDEATSALDSETEKTIKDNIDRLHGKYTIIIVAHRLSTVKNADLIVLLQKGKIIATGNFESLLKNPLFEKMVQLQEF